MSKVKRLVAVDNLTTSFIPVIQGEGVPFILSLITAALSHRKLASADVPLDSYHSEVNVV